MIIWLSDNTNNSLLFYYNINTLSIIINLSTSHSWHQTKKNKIKPDFSLDFLYKPLPFHSDWSPGRWISTQVCSRGRAWCPTTWTSWTWAMPWPPWWGDGRPRTKSTRSDPRRTLRLSCWRETCSCPAAAQRCRADTTFQKHILTLSFSLCSCTIEPTRPYTRGSSASSHTVNCYCLCVCCCLKFR